MGWQRVGHDWATFTFMSYLLSASRLPCRVRIPVFHDNKRRKHSVLSPRPGTAVPDSPRGQFLISFQVPSSGRSSPALKTTPGSVYPPDLAIAPHSTCSDSNHIVSVQTLFRAGLLSTTRDTVLHPPARGLACGRQELSYVWRANGNPDSDRLWGPAARGREGGGRGKARPLWLQDRLLPGSGCQRGLNGVERSACPPWKSTQLSGRAPRWDALEGPPASVGVGGRFQPGDTPIPWGSGLTRACSISKQNRMALPTSLRLWNTSVLSSAYSMMSFSWWWKNSRIPGRCRGRLSGTVLLSCVSAIACVTLTKTPWTRHCDPSFQTRLREGKRLHSQWAGQREWKPEPWAPALSCSDSRWPSARHLGF